MKNYFISFNIVRKGTRSWDFGNCLVVRDKAIKNIADIRSIEQGIILTGEEIEKCFINNFILLESN